MFKVNYLIFFVNSLNKIIQKLGEKEMAYSINDKCTTCGACKPECPVDAISEGNPKYIIDPDTCISCGACSPACPSEAIDPD